MKEQGIENFLKDVKAPAPDAEARLRAKRAALAEFERAQANNLLQFPSQETAGDDRLSREHTSHGSTAMESFANRRWYAVAAGVGVVALGLSWVLPNLDRYTTEISTPVAATAEPGPAGRTELPASAAGPEPRADAPEGAAAATQASPGDRAASTPATPPADLAASVAALEDERRAAVEASRLAAARAQAAEKESLFKSQAEPALVPAPPPAAQPGETDMNAVTVTGLRGHLASALEVKREASTVVDSISAEDIGSFPDSKVAESLQRIPAITIAPNEAPAPGAVAGYHDEGRDKFQHFEINPVRRVSEEPVSTFSADVDTASYSFVRARLNEGDLPEKDAVRAEEMINYFDYAWPASESRSAPFKPTVVVGDSPWNKGRKLVHIGIKGYEVERDRAPDANLVLLLDVSGSMNEPNKLPLVVRSMELLLGSLKPGDTVGIVVYAGAAGTVLEPTPARDKEKIVAALRSLRPGGSTAGAEGIERAYQLAEAHFRKGGVNRILLCTDGDFNVGIDGTEALKGFVERKREKGVYLSVLGFGEGNYRDELAQALAQNGNGVAAYIDTENEARKVLVEEASAALFTIAKDVKLQVEFNPATVSEYRLVGYETRALKREDFNNDAVDAGDVGAGHTVTAIYEITPAGAQGSVDQPYFEGNRAAQSKPRGRSDLYGFLKIRYKLPGEKESKLISEPIPLRSGAISTAVKRDVDFSTAVAGFAQLLRGGTHTGSLRYDDVIEAAQAARGDDRFGYRAEFIELVRRARKAQQD